MARNPTPERPVPRPPLGTEHLLLLRWLLLVVVSGFGLVAAWHYGLVQRVWTDDPTGITLGIVALFLLTLGDGALHAVRLSRTLNHTAVVERWIERRDALQLRRDLSAEPPSPELPEGAVMNHLCRLWRKANRAGAGVQAADQELLLQVFDVSLRRGQDVAWFIADMLLTLGLIGTVVGFIGMLAPLGGLDPANTAAMKRAIGAMSGGMAVALYTTLAGLVGGVVLRVQGLLLADAADDVVRRTTELAELHVIPLIRAAAAMPGDRMTTIATAERLEVRDAAA